MYKGLLHAHSGIRWIILALLVITVIKAIAGLAGKKTYTKGDAKLSLFTFVFTNIQFLVGLILYFISSKVAFSAETMSNAMIRFFTVEHVTLTIIAVALINIGYSRAKKSTSDEAKFKKTAIFYGIALLLVLAAIPWPFRGLGTGWF